MKNINGNIFYLLLMLFFSCTGEKTYDNVEKLMPSDFGNEIRLSGKKVDLDSMILNPYKMILKDSLLIIYNVRMEYAFQIFNMNTKKYIGKSILIGNGPQEMVSPKFIHSKDNNIWLYDQEKSTVCEYSIPSFICENKTKVVPVKAFRLDVPSENLSVIGNRVFSFRLYDNLKDNRFIFFNLNGKVMSSKGEFPLKFNDILSDGINFGFASEYTTNFANRIFLSYRLTDLIEIYDMEGTLVKRIFGPDHFMPKVKEVKNGTISFANGTGETREAYFYPANAGNEVFATYSGELYSKNVFHKGKIYVFDWNGKPLRRYILDIRIYGTIVDSRNRIIYGFNDEPECHLVQFKY